MYIITVYHHLNKGVQQSMFNEREALQMTLRALLDQRLALRRQYVDQDKQLGEEIRQLLNRIREIDSEGELEKASCQEVAAADEVFSFDMYRPIKVRKTHVRQDYEEVARHVKEILQERMTALTLADLYEELKERHGVEFSSPYIGMQKALKYLPEVKVEKSGRKLLFSLSV